jgi:amino acid permease
MSFRQLKDLLRRIIPIILAGLVMSLVVLALKSFLHVFLLMPIGAVAYILALFALRGVHLHELRRLKHELRPSSYAQTQPPVDA